MTNVSMRSVCICLPVYNAGATLADTLESLISQTYKNISIRIVDNCSTDNTHAIAQQFAQRDARIRIIPFDVTVPAEGNFTRCIELAEGDYTAIYHADDLYRPDMVERQVTYLETHPDTGAVFTSAHHISSANTIIGQHSMPPDIGRSVDTELDFGQTLKAVLQYGNFLICPSAMVRTSIYKDHIRIWDGKRYRTSADLDVWLRILQKQKIGILNEPLMQYRMGNSSLSYRAIRLGVERADIFRVLDHYVDIVGSSLLDSRDRTNYALLTFRDTVSRAINALLMEDSLLARSLLTNALTLPLLKSSVMTMRSLGLLCISCIIYVLTFIPLGQWGRTLLAKARFGKHFSLSRIALE